MMNYLEVQGILAKYTPHLSRFFADRWSRFPSDGAAVSRAHKVRKSADNMRSWLPEAAAELDAAAAEIEKERVLRKVDCSQNGWHKYSERLCPKCGHVYCYACCQNQNIDEGGKYAKDFMICPRCGHDYYSE